MLMPFNGFVVLLSQIFDAHGLSRQHSLTDKLREQFDWIAGYPQCTIKEFLRYWFARLTWQKEFSARLAALEKCYCEMKSYFKWHETYGNSTLRYAHRFRQEKFLQDNRQVITFQYIVMPICQQVDSSDQRRCSKNNHISGFPGVYVASVAQRTAIKIKTSDVRVTNARSALKMCVGVYGINVLYIYRVWFQSDIVLFRFRAHIRVLICVSMCW